MTDVAGHLLVFAVCGVVLFVIPLVIGKFIRPRRPSAEKDAVYECGEPTIGSSFIQFDLRFYVVALLFIVFDVELVFFFPWAQVFGSATQLADASLSQPAAEHLTMSLFPELATSRISQLPGSPSSLPVLPTSSALVLGWMAFVDVIIFFAVLLVGFAYLWKRGDLDWVRADELRSVAAGRKVS
ncbi:MAG: NADH-quinone oxidoreductase subunit A [Planctomyces sp.]|nr:NADH-quinone oxidoreductase subunit A [Planctomyces sp.]